MARISDPDKLIRSTGASTTAGGTPDGNVYFNTTNLTIELISTTDGWSAGSGNELISAGGNDGGVDLQTVYSFLKEAWKSETDLIRYPFPMEAITAEQFEFINGWTLTDGTSNVDSRPYIRTGGWAERDAGGTVQAEYMGVITLGNIESNHRAYYAFAGDVAKSPFTYDGPVNEPVQIFENGGDDNRDVLFTAFIRSAPEGSVGNVTGWTFGKSTSVEIGVSTLTNQVFRYPLTETQDINITKLDTEINSGGSGAPDTAPYSNMDIEYYSTAQSLAVGQTSYNFGVVIDANSADNGLNPTLSDIYQFVQYQLRQEIDISSGDGDESGVIGALADELVQFVGADLKTLRQSDNDGVYVADFNSDFINNVGFVDNTGTERNFPFKASVTLSFSDTLIEDPEAKYFLFYSTNPTGNFGTGTAVVVTDDNSQQVTGDLHKVALTGIAGAQSGTGASTTANSRVLSGVSGYTVDELAGEVLSITSGDNAGKYFIESNTATTITIATGSFFEATDADVDYELLFKNTNGTVQFVYNYAGNTDGGRTADTDADVTFVALGLDNAQYALTTGKITETSAITIPITSPLERNYADPANI